MSTVVHFWPYNTAQARSLAGTWPKCLVTQLKRQMLEPSGHQPRCSAAVVEIGFGMRRIFTEMAQQDPERNYLGIEVHPPGVGLIL